MILKTASAIPTSMPSGWESTVSDAATTVTFGPDGATMRGISGDYSAPDLGSPYVDGDRQIVAEFTWGDGVGSQPTQIVNRRSDRSSGGQYGTGYRLNITPTGLWFWSKKSWGGETESSTTTVDLDRGVRYRVRFRQEGAHLSARVWPASNPEPSAWLAEWDSPDLITDPGSTVVAQKSTGSTADTTNTVTFHRILTYDLAGDSDTTPQLVAASVEHGVGITAVALDLGGLTVEAHNGPASEVTAVRAKGSVMLTADGLAISDGVGGWTVK